MNRRSPPSRHLIALLMLAMLLNWLGSVYHHHCHGALSAVSSQALAQEAQAFDADFAEELALASPGQNSQDGAAPLSHHIGVDGCLASTGPLPAGVASPQMTAGSEPPLVSAEATPAAPFIEGLRRPPKAWA
jgi:hypothetical protein